LLIVGACGGSAPPPELEAYPEAIAPTLITKMKGVSSLFVLEHETLSYRFDAFGQERNFTNMADRVNAQAEQGCAGSPWSASFDGRPAVRAVYLDFGPNGCTFPFGTVVGQATSHLSQVEQAWVVSTHFEGSVETIPQIGDVALSQHGDTDYRLQVSLDGWSATVTFEGVWWTAYQDPSNDPTQGGTLDGSSVPMSGVRSASQPV